MKNMNTRLAVVLAMCVCTGAFALYAILQYEAAPNTLNPALTGMYENA